MSIPATYVSSYVMTTTSGTTDDYTPGRRVKCDCGVDGYRYGWISKSSGTTTITINLTTDSDALTSNLTQFWVGHVDASRKLVIPTDEPDDLVDGCIWIA